MFVTRRNRIFQEFCALKNCRFRKENETVLDDTQSSLQAVWNKSVAKLPNALPCPVIDTNFMHNCNYYAYTKGDLSGQDLLFGVIRNYPRKKPWWPSMYAPMLHTA